MKANPGRHGKDIPCDLKLCRSVEARWNFQDTRDYRLLFWWLVYF